MSTREERMKKEGYRDVPGRDYSVKVNKQKREFSSADEALAHHEATGSDAADKLIAGYVNGPKQ